ncbi:MAG: cytochrome oxidase small assembly protein [bacterium]
MPKPKNPDNLKTALILASIVAIFFFGVIIKQAWFR